MKRAAGWPQDRPEAPDPGAGVTVKLPKLRNFYWAPAAGKLQLLCRTPGCARDLLAFPVRCRTLRPKERSEGWSGWPKGDRKENDGQRQQGEDDGRRGRTEGGGDVSHGVA